MRYSVLLPTRNGGKFINNCIRSILEQGADLELIVSDNANTDDTAAVLEGWRNEPRMRILRLDTPVSVTENWNNALRAARGEYLLMMGDDDCLMPGYFHHMDAIIDRHGDPDCVIHNAYSFVAPHSIGQDANSYFGAYHFHYEPALGYEQELAAELRHSIVRDMFRFRVRIPLNMQTTLVKRTASILVPGGLFQAPFPDHFALNSLLLKASRWIFTPERLVVVGVSPKSFGHYVYSHQQANGLAYLGIQSDFPGRLPGNELLNGMHTWLDMLLATFPGDLHGVRVDRRGYVRRQVYAWLMQLKLGALDPGELLMRFRQLRFRDWLALSATALDRESWQRLTQMFSARSKSSIEQQWSGLTPLPNIRNITEFANWAARSQNS